MPRYYPNTRFSDCWSSVGDVTFYHRDGVCYFRKRAICSFGGSAGQMAVSDVHHRALAAWRELSHDVQLQWNVIAASVRPHRPPFDGSAHITGHNLFVSAYHGFAQLGNEHVPVPMARRAFPPFSGEMAGCEAVDGVLVVRFRVRMPQESEPSRYRLHTKMQLTTPGGGKRPGYMRVFVADGNCSSSDCIVEVRVPDYKTLWNLNLTSYRMHCRLSLIDTVTGYRNDWIAGSFDISL
jgi:hypothetical protein